MKSLSANKARSAFHLQNVSSAPSKHSVKLLEHDKYHFLTEELYCSVRSFDEETCICDTCHKHISRNETPCQAVFKEMSLDSIPDKLKDFKKIGKNLNFQENNVSTIAKRKGSICNIPLKQEIYALFWQNLQRFKQIDCDKIKMAS